MKIESENKVESYTVFIDRIEPMALYLQSIEGIKNFEIKSNKIELKSEIVEFQIEANSEILKTINKFWKTLMRI